MRRGQLSLLALAAAGAHALAGHSVLEQESPKPIDPSPIAPGSMRTDQDPKDTFVPLSDLPPAQQWMRLFSKDCRRCVKQCMGKRVAVAQQNSLKIQAPISLITWYLFQNRPFRMWPLEDAPALLTKVNPAVWVGAVAAMWLSCENHCDYDCPYPNMHAKKDPLIEKLESVDPTDTSILSRLMHGARRGGGGGGGGGGGMGKVFSEAFRIL